MFTGIIEQMATVVARESNRLRIRPESPLADVRPGDSLAVNGVCLTATRLEGGIVAADVSDETRTKTTLGRLRSGDRVNLEPALALGKPLGGHLLQGHVDCVSEVQDLIRKTDSWMLGVRIPEEFKNLVVARGSIAIDGISLTIARLEDSLAWIALVPHTVQHTIITGYSSGRAVNIEFDIIGKYVVRYLEGASGSESAPLTTEQLRKLGF